MAFSMASVGKAPSSSAASDTSVSGREASSTASVIPAARCTASAASPAVSVSAPRKRPFSQRIYPAAYTGAAVASGVGSAVASGTGGGVTDAGAGVRRRLTPGQKSASAASSMTASTAPATMSQTVFFRFFTGFFVSFTSAMGCLRKESVQGMGIRMSGARSAAQKSLVEFAPAGAKKFKTFLPAACTLVKLLPGSQTCEQSEYAAARGRPRQTRAMQRKALVCVFTVDGRRGPCKGSPFLHPKFRIVPRRCARSR